MSAAVRPLTIVTNAPGDHVARIDPLVPLRHELIGRSQPLVTVLPRQALRGRRVTAAPGATGDA